MVVQVVARKTGTKVVRRATNRRASRSTARRVRRTEDRVALEQGAVQARQRAQKAYHDARASAEAIFSERGEQFTGDDEDEIKYGEEKSSGFPIFMFTIALIKDLIDPIQFGLITGIVVFFPSVAITIILMVWYAGKLKGAWWKKRAVKVFWRKFILTVCIEMLPIINIAPATTFMVFMAWRHEDKFVKMFNEALDEYRRSGVLRYLK